MLHPPRGCSGFDGGKEEADSVPRGLTAAYQTESKPQLPQTTATTRPQRKLLSRTQRIELRSRALDYHSG